jgi:hypothetical protein
VNVVIPQVLAQAIHDYLMTRPMAEVETMVNGLRAAQMIDTNGSHPIEDIAPSPAES